MKPYLLTMCAVLFILCLMLFGFRGIGTALISTLAFIGGVRVGQKEAAVSGYVDRLIAKAKKQVTDLFK